jgi:hypothetical protein
MAWAKRGKRTGERTSKRTGMRQKARPLSPGGGSPPVTVAPVFYITGGSGASAETIADEVMRRMEKSVAAAMRGAMADVGG